MCIVAALTYTVYLVAIERARATTASLPLIAMATLATLPPMLAFALAVGEPMMPHNWTPLLLLAIGSQCLGQGLIAYALGRLSPLIVGLALMIQPIVGSAVGWIFYGERLALADFAGALMIGAALVLVRLKD
jgi:drug/metabolite transporter (DMT)-like permease